MLLQSLFLWEHCLYAARIVEKNFVMNQHECIIFSVLAIG